MQFLCNEFLTNYREAQEQGKTFHYSWLLLSILLVVGELPEDSQFPTVEGDLPEVTRYTFLLEMKDAMRIHEIKVFCVLLIGREEGRRRGSGWYGRRSTLPM